MNNSDDRRRLWFFSPKGGVFLDEKGSPEGVNDISIKAVWMLAYKQN